MKINDPLARPRGNESFGVDEHGELDGVPLGVESNRRGAGTDGRGLA